ncbi:hypothetical protein CCP1ISM_8430001 [Azospirillaceae bacterium]
MSCRKLEETIYKTSWTGRVPTFLSLALILEMDCAISEHFMVAFMIGNLKSSRLSLDLGCILRAIFMYEQDDWTNRYHT